MDGEHTANQAISKSQVHIDLLENVFISELHIVLKYPLLSVLQISAYSCQVS